MALINYDLIIVSDRKERIKKYRKYNNSVVKLNNNSFKIRVNQKFVYSEAYLEDTLYDGVIIDTKQYEMDIVNTILFYNNQSEIFIFNNPEKPNIDHKNCKYFNESDPLDKIIIEFFHSRRFSTPFFSQMKKLARSKKERWHTPGHVGGAGFEKFASVRDFKRFYKNNIFLTDTSVSDPSFGSLLSHTGAFKEAEKLMSNAYGTIASFINVHGTSTSNKVVYMTILNKGDKVIVDRNMHKSTIHSIIVSGANPIFLKANYHPDFGIILPTRKEILLKQIEENKDAKLLSLTVPTYDGLRYYLPEIIDYAHSFKMKVLVDEAWGAHMHFHTDFYPDALQSGADYVVQSTHKTMGGFSQSSVIHVNDRDFNEKKKDFYENYMFFSSTSPFYPLVASIDVSRKMMSIEGKQVLEKLKKYYNTLVEEIDRMEEFKVLKRSCLKDYFTNINEILIDYSRIVVNFSFAGITKKQIWNYLVKNNIIVEKINYKSFTLLLGVGTTSTMVNHLLRVLKNFKYEKLEKFDQSHFFLWDDLEVKIPPFEAYQSEGEWLDLKNCSNRISSNMIVPYPPGIPLIIPGQVVTMKHIENLLTFTPSDDIEIHGIAKGKIKVLKEKR
ncbi:MAG: aminotransferase class I/II-fold pyridoxal phosphate-dependent enzyme [bacterium]|nr:aminotransferase class I/II-fold pyridoxal phosphate-dependent enzyme [bacterium]